jgi:hypothetical protein
MGDPPLRAAGLGPLLCLALLACAVTTPAEGAPLPPLPRELWQHWVHSFEEDTATVKAYRPRSYEFPPARGREGFELRENGEYVRYDIARGDGNVRVKGSWKQVGALKIEVETGEGKPEREVLRILSCEDGVLKLRK